MICNLCKQDKERLCQAHLIPRAFYRFMYPTEKIEGEPLKMVMQGKDYMKTSRIGLYDDKILCAECDSFIGKLDDFAAKTFLQNPLIKEGALEYIEIFSFGNIDIYKLKVFLLSVLWRCSISSREEMGEVYLGEKNNEKIRQILLNESDNVDEFPIIITRYKFTNHDYSKVMFLPKKLRMNNLNYYWLFLSNGFKILIKVDRRDHGKEFESMALHSERKAHVFSFESFEQTNEYFKTRDKVRSLSKLL